MSIAELRQKWKAGARLCAQLNQEFRTGRATRPACEVERRLAVCRNCREFRADTCAEIELHPEGPAFHQLLTRVDLYCPRWSTASPLRERLHASRPDADEQRRAEELLGRIARMHEEGPTRSQAERRAARREGRRRRKGEGGRRNAPE